MKIAFLFGLLALAGCAHMAAFTEPEHSAKLDSPCGPSTCGKKVDWEVL